MNQLKAVLIWLTKSIELFIYGYTHTYVNIYLTYCVNIQNPPFFPKKGRNAHEIRLELCQILFLPL